MVGDGEADEPLTIRPDVSVVIPAKNAAAVLPTQLKALARQSINEPFEVIVADNGSTDETVRLAAPFRDQLPLLKVVDAGAERGSAYARNVGVAHSTGNRIVFADADDEVAPGYVGALAEALRHHAVVAARIDWQLLNPWLRPVGLPTDQTTGVSGGVFGWLPFAFGGAMGVKRDAFQSVGGFDETVPRADDVELCWRLGLSGYRITFVPDAVVSYRLRASVRDTFKQSRANGRDGPWLYRRYRAQGMPRHSAKVAVRFWFGAVRALARCRSREDLYSCASLAGVRVGIIEGCVRHRAIYF